MSRLTNMLGSLSGSARRQVLQLKVTTGEVGHLEWSIYEHYESFVDTMEDLALEGIFVDREHVFPMLSGLFDGIIETYVEQDI